MLLFNDTAVPSLVEGRDAYRRAARRLRAALRHDHSRLYRSLTTLARGRDRHIRQSIERPADRFARMVEASLDSTVLRYSQRLGLLRRAKYFGLDRFEANLLIAAVQHRVKTTRQPHDRRIPGWVISVTLFLIAQCIILLSLGAMLNP